MANRLNDFLDMPFSSFFNRLITDMAMGSIITVVAVLLIHILINAVAIINPKIIPLGLVPVAFTRFKAIRLCRFLFSIPRAIRNPPIKRKIIGCAYEFAASEMVKTFSRGNNTSGSIAVTDKGTVSVTHQVIIQTATAITFQAVGSRISGEGIVRITMKSKGPNIKLGHGKDLWSEADSNNGKFLLIKCEN